MRAMLLQRVWAIAHLSRLALMSATKQNSTPQTPDSEYPKAKVKRVGHHG
jgi:hypothetical protein